MYKFQGFPPEWRDFHTACVIGSKMYIFGGRSDLHGQFHSSRDVYNDRLKALDLNTNNWEEPRVTGEAPSGRRSHSACKLLVFFLYLMITGPLLAQSTLLSLSYFQGFIEAKCTFLEVIQARRIYIQVIFTNLTPSASIGDEYTRLVKVPLLEDVSVRLLLGIASFFSEGPCSFFSFAASLILCFFYNYCREQC